MCRPFNPDKGTAKVARQLGFDYAEAVVRVRPPRAVVFLVLS